MKKCLISGGTGLIGQEVTRLLREEGWELYVTTRSQEKMGREGVNYIYCDFSRDWDVSVFPPHVDAVLHLAQSEYFRDFPERASHIFDTNLSSTNKLLEYARLAGAKSFVLASSGGIYGLGPDRFTENTPVSLGSEIGFYLTTKACADLVAQNYTPFMKVIILRPFFVYGPNQRQDMLIPRLVNSVKEGKPIILYGDSGIRINPIYVGDAALAFCKALYLDRSMTINIAGTEILDLRSVAREIGGLVGKDPVFECNQVNVPRDCISDITVMKQYLCTPKVSFREGIKRVIENS